MSAGNYSFTYVAVDDFKNKAKCNFTVSIADTTPPIFENCISNQTIYVLTNDNASQKVEWEEPFVYDSVDDKNVHVTASLQHGIYEPGDYIVNYTATDKSGNTNSCLINVFVRERKCDELPKPENGLRVCAKNFTNTWCDFRCNFGYGLTENDSVVENVVLFCDNIKKTWSSDNLPECSKIEQPNSVEEVLTISLDSGNLCDEESKSVSTHDARLLSFHLFKLLNQTATH